jgi:hypothetical protein
LQLWHCRARKAPPEAGDFTLVLRQNQHRKASIDGGDSRLRGERRMNAAGSILPRLHEPGVPHGRPNGGWPTTAFEESPMFTRSSIAALLAVAAVGAIALAPTSASAYVPKYPLKPIHKPIFTPKLPLKPIHLPLKPLKPIHPIHPIVWPHHHHHHWWWVKWHRPHYVVQPVVATTMVSAPVVQRTESTCSCLTKQYLADGSVLFKDVCTKEEAMATPDELKAQADARVQGTAPQVR